MKKFAHNDAVSGKYKRMLSVPSGFKPEQVKHCISCKAVKPFSEFYTNKKCTDGVSGICKECQIASTKRSKQRQALERLMSPKFPKSVEKINDPVYEVYVPEKAIYRNDGNKHILSRGVRC